MMPAPLISSSFPVPRCVLLATWSKCEVTREAASDVLGWLRRQGILDDGSVTMSETASAPSKNARITELAAPGAPDDAIVWEAVVDNAYGEARDHGRFTHS